MKCDKCGLELTDDHQFCHKCGNKIEVPNNLVKDNVQNEIINPVQQSPIVQSETTNPVQQIPVATSIPKPRKLGLPLIIAAIGIIAILILSIGAVSVPAIQVTLLTQEQQQVPYQDTITTPVQVAYQETTQVPYEVSYQDTTQNNVDLKYTSTYDWSDSGITDWGIDVQVSITNIDTEAGQFTATVRYYNGTELKTTQTKTVTIEPGSTQVINFRDASLEFHWDWETRYSVQVSITPGQRTVTSSELKTKTEYKTEVVTKYRTENQTQTVTKYRTEIKDVYTNKTVTLLQYLTGSY